MRPKPFLMVVLIGMLLVSACQGVSTPATAYPNATDIKSEKEAINSIQAPENIVQAIQRIEGKDSHVKVGGSSGFLDPSLTGVILTTYQTETRSYAFYDLTDQLISISPKDKPSARVPISTEELEKIARDLVARASPEINLDMLAPDHGEKRSGDTANFFFQWIDNSKMLSNGLHPQIQVGLNGKGELISYYNTIPLAINPTDTVTPDEIDVSVIQRVEGIHAQVKVGGGSGFTLTPLFSSDSFLSKYETNSRYYALDGITRRIVAIDPKTMPAGIVELPVSELEKMVRDLIALAEPDLDLDKLNPNHSSKTGTYLFHWDDPTKRFEDGTYYYIQVKVNGRGELISYVNLIPLAR